MSQQLISRSRDLRRLRDEGYEVSVRADHLVVGHVPYVAPDRSVRFGTVVSELTRAAGKTKKPGTHVLHFIGEYPCDAGGKPIEQIRNQSQRRDLGGGLVIDHTFSNKPADGYRDYYQKITTYVRILAGPAHALDSAATASTFASVSSAEEDDPFDYSDTNSSRADIDEITARTRGHSVAIVGLGGTGAYVLDLVAKTPVKTIHLFDGDRFVQHNAFRSPGAPTNDQLAKTPLKTDYFRDVYSGMHRGIVSHPYFVTSENIAELLSSDFAFVCVDRGDARKLVVEALEAAAKPFADTGMGVNAVDSKLRGIVRLTVSTPEMREHFRKRASFEDAPDDAYHTNIQIAELNMLNAALAVIKWKKLLGVYADSEHEHNTTYTIDVNMLLSEDNAA